MSDAELSSEQVRRAVIQKLEDLRRSGITHWKKIATVAPIAPAATESGRLPTSTRPISTGQALDKPRATLERPPLNASTSAKLFEESESSELAKKKAIAAPVPVPITPFEPLDLPLAERVNGLAALAQCVKQCTRCPELASTRTQTVFGVGNPQAKILFVGEAPGADEDAQGEPFVGKSGQLLNDIIKACRIRREDIYICNVLRCRPPGNRLPAPEEAANCREFLDGQIAHVNPEYIVCWGACAAQNLLRMTDAIGKLRGRFYTYGRAKVLCTYHPSYLMRNPSAKKDVWEDMKLLFLDMGVDLTKPKA